MGPALCGKEERRHCYGHCIVWKGGEEAVLWALHCVERRRGGSVMGTALCGKEERRLAYERILYGKEKRRQWYSMSSAWFGKEVKRLWYRAVFGAER